MRSALEERSFIKFHLLPQPLLRMLRDHLSRQVRSGAGSGAWAGRRP